MTQVSVLLPVRDALPFLPSSLRSVERQTFGDFEVVAVDDGSTDGSADLLQAQAQRDPRFRVVPGRASGLVDALNDGLEHCRGEFVARHDADDVMLPRRLELQVEALRRRTDLGVVSCRVRSMPRSTLGEGFRRYDAWLNRLLEHDDIYRERFVESPVAHPSILARRTVLLEAGGYRDRGWAEDYDLWLRLLGRGVRFAKVDRVLHLWRDHGGRLTRTDERYTVERFLNGKAHHLADGPLRGVRTVVIWGAGQTGRRLAKALRASGVEPAAFVDIDAKKIGRRPGGVPVHGVEDLVGLLGNGPSVVLVAVSRRGAHGIIRPRLLRRGLTEGRDFWFVS